MHEYWTGSSHVVVCIIYNYPRQSISPATEALYNTKSPKAVTKCTYRHVSLAYTLQQCMT